MYELKKIGKIFMSKFVGTGPSSYEKKKLPGRGLTKVEKHWPRGYCTTRFTIRKLYVLNYTVTLAWVSEKTAIIFLSSTETRCFTVRYQLYIFIYALPFKGLDQGCPKLLRQSATTFIVGMFAGRKCKISRKLNISPPKLVYFFL